jgi:hypothetical protein
MRNVRGRNIPALEVLLSNHARVIGAYRSTAGDLAFPAVIVWTPTRLVYIVLAVWTVHSYTFIA